MVQCLLWLVMQVLIVYAGHCSERIQSLFSVLLFLSLLANGGLAYLCNYSHFISFLFWLFDYWPKMFHCNSPFTLISFWKVTYFQCGLIWTPLFILNIICIFNFIFTTPQCFTDHTRNANQHCEPRRNCLNSGKSSLLSSSKAVTYSDHQFDLFPQALI